MKIDRSLDDEAMDNIDHALGRPADVMAKGCRDHFAIPDDSPEILQFRASRYWEEGVTRNSMTYFHVSIEGRRALMRYLKDTDQQPRLYAVTVFGHTQTVAAKSRSAARYQRYLEADSGMSFFEFIRGASVRAA